jgi:hypothetical protein
LNDSFAHVKRELAATQHRNEMTEFMWSTFQKVAGINNHKTSEDDDEKMKSMNQEHEVPLAQYDGDVL